MIATVRRCDHAKCAKDIVEGGDFYVLTVNVTKQRNDRAPGGVGQPLLVSVASALPGTAEVCSPACATSFVAALLDGARPGGGAS